MNEYLRKRFEERLLSSPLLEGLHDYEDPDVDRLLSNLVEGLITEVDGMDLR